VAAVVAAMAAARGARWFVPVAAALVLWQALALRCLPRENDLRHFESVALYDESGAPTRRYPEWQAAASMILTNPWLGVGPGSYQRQVGPYYERVPNATGPAEPDIQNLYLVLAASCGLPALLAFLAMLSTAAGAAVGARRAGVAGALAAFALAAVWHPLLVRGIGLPLAFLLALAHHPNTAEADDVP
jgi:O-antigen ligase